MLTQGLGRPELIVEEHQEQRCSAGKGKSAAKGGSSRGRDSALSCKSAVPW